MEGNSSSALKDMLKSPSPPKPVLARSDQFTPATWADPVFSNPRETSIVAGDQFSDLSLDESPLSSLNSFDAAFPYSSSSSSSCLFCHSDLQSEASSDHEKEEVIMVFGNSTRKDGVFPPPISSLELFNKGMRYSYLNYEEDDDTLVLEEIRIPHGDILRANRSGGRLRLAFVISDGESSDMEEEEEINENAG
ncbi:protein FANTASTIC FOUR [Salix suchowensis]|uniref:FAF domain-containing protein n=1 Tax=Salix udensis TaxID=889485 RepID=A0AAD6PGA2_9ROSI|nr:protein FANTASTIC FOUR [Salix suchowensis]KAJ6428759.1 hypothetical protein OIU84_020428 [Salix udensis]